MQSVCLLHKNKTRYIGSKTHKKRVHLPRMCLKTIGAQANESGLKTEAAHFSIFYFSHFKPNRKNQTRSQIFVDGKHFDLVCCFRIHNTLFSS